MSVGPPYILNLQPGSPHHYRPAPAFTFHPYEHDSSHDDSLHDDPIAPPALSNKRASRLSAPFPTFLYASEPPPVTARNKQRVRPSAAQLAELKALYTVTAHPPRDAREALGHKIGMRYQSVTNWFQNQRSTAKKRAPTADPATAPPSQTKSRSSSRSRMTSTSPIMSPRHIRDDEEDMYYSGDEDGARGQSLERDGDGTDDRQFSPFHARLRIDPVRDIIVAQAEARQQHLVELPLPLSGTAIVPSTLTHSPDADHSYTMPSVGTLNITLPPIPRTTSASASPSIYSRAPTPPLLSSFQVSRASSPSASTLGIGADEMHGSIAEYGDDAAGDQVPRGKRSRPTPHQLAALRALHAITSSPSIDERTRVGREIGMCVFDLSILIMAIHLLTYLLSGRELGKVTNWFRNLRQTARKKERRALAAEEQGQGIAQSGVRAGIGAGKRTRSAADPDDSSSFSRTRQSKRARVGEGDATAHMHTGAFDDMDMDEYERSEADADPHDPHDGVYFGHQRREGLDDSFNSPFGEGSRDRDREHEHEHYQEARSELGTESDAAHEAVTPEPHGPATPSSTSPSRPTSPRTGTHMKRASVDDAMLLLAFHSAHA
ncbi:hypothetical protein K439DRAFT_1623379 [Ramaria rubella]|nr:hypothetical protein K439DRAFT_1623379 [Ramaria rubella]